MLITIVVAILYGTTVELPLFLQTLMGYPALQSGYALSPRGIGAFVTTMLVGRLVGRVRNRWLMCIGFPVLAMASFMLSDINLQVSEAARHLAQRHQRHRHQFYFRAADDGGRGASAPGPDGQCHRPLQSHAQPRRQHRHRLCHHHDPARRANAPGADGRAFDADQSGVTPPSGRFCNTRWHGTPIP